MPTVSVILPTYNRAKYLDRAIKSVLDQTYTDFELIIIDDGSTDNTDQVVGSFSDDRIKHIKHSSNKGAAAARNTGLEKAQGEYIAFQDSDDKWLPKKLEKQINIFKNHSKQLGMVYSNRKSINMVDGRKIIYSPVSLRPKDGYIYNKFLRNLANKKWGIALVTVMIKSDCFNKIGYFDERLNRLIDTDLFIRLAQYYLFYHIDKSLINFSYKTPGAIGTNKLWEIQSLDLIFHKHKKNIQNTTISKLQYHLGYWYSIFKKYDKAKMYLKKTIRNGPFNFKYLFIYLLTKIGPGITSWLLRLKNRVEYS